LQHHHSTSAIEHLQAVSRSTTSVYEKLLRKDMQDRIRHMHEILPEKIARSTSRYQAKARLLALAMASLPALASAQDARSQAPPYCFDLTRVVDLAMTKERFASIAGRPRQGSYVGTGLVLAGWKDCSLYGAATYTCDSSEMDTAEEAEKARAAILMEAVAGVLATDDGRILWRGTPLALPQRREFMFYLRRTASLGGPIRRARDRILRGCLRQARGRRSRHDPIARPRAGPAQAHRCIVQGLWPPAHAGAGFADPPPPAADGRAVRRLRPAANARDHERGARRCAQWAHARSRHSPVERCRALCDRFVLLAAGRVRGVGTLAQLRAQAGKPAAGLEEVFLALT
jgi:ABC-2 type transport system ATP-binding protein